MNWIAIAALNMALAVMTGAFGAHALKARLSPEALEEVEAFLAAIDANDDVQEVYVGLAG